MTHGYDRRTTYALEFRNWIPWRWTPPTAPLRAHFDDDGQVVLYYPAYEGMIAPWSLENGLGDVRHWFIAVLDPDTTTMTTWSMGSVENADDRIWVRGKDSEFGSTGQLEVTGDMATLDESFLAGTARIQVGDVLTSYDGETMASVLDELFGDLSAADLRAMTSRTECIMSALGVSSAYAGYMLMIAGPTPAGFVVAAVSLGVAVWQAEQIADECW